MVRGTSTRQPKSCLVSNHDRCRRCSVLLADHGYSRDRPLGRRQRLGRLEFGGDGGERGRPGALPGGRAGDGDGERGVRLAAGGDEFGGGGGDRSGGWWRPRASRRSSPTSCQHRSEAVAASTNRTSPAERHAGVRGHAERRGDTRHHLEGDAGLGAGEHLGGGAGVESGVARDRTHHPLAGARGRHDKLGGSSGEVGGRSRHLAVRGGFCRAHVRAGVRCGRRRAHGCRRPARRRGRAPPRRAASAARGRRVLRRGR